jgi:hypothetical protein
VTRNMPPARPGANRNNTDGLNAGQAHISNAEIAEEENPGWDSIFILVVGLAGFAGMRCRDYA